MIVNLSKFKLTSNTIFVLSVALFLALCAGVCYAETALEGIVRESKNPLSKPAPGSLLVNKAERSRQEKKSKELVSPDAVAAIQSNDRPRLEQRIDEIIVKAQREPEDFKPPELSSFQNMRVTLNRAGPNLPSAVMEYTGTDGIVMVCTQEGNYCNKTRRISGVSAAGDLRTDGKLGSGTFR